MARTTPENVRSVIETVPTIDLDFHITQAAVVTARVEAAGLTDEDTLLLIETFLAAHYYSLRDPLYKSRTVGSASGVFQDRDFWKEAAKLDSTGTLDSMTSGGQGIDIIWLGLPASEQTEWRDRN